MTGYVLRSKSAIVNTTKLGHQFDARMTRLSNGGYALAWTDGSETNQDTDGYAVMAQYYNAAGKKVGGEIAVNTVTTGNQMEPSIITLKSGNVVVAWAGGVYNDYDVRAQILGKSGKPVGNEFVLNTQTDLVQHAPDLTPLANGGFVAVWQSSAVRAFGYNEGIRAQFFSATGKKVGAELAIDVVRHPGAVLPSVTSLTDGSVVVTWTTSNDNPGNYGDLYGQRISAAGKKIGDNFVIDEQPHHIGQHSVVTALAGGGFIVTWDSTLPRGINARIFGADGKPIGDAFVVSDEYANYDNPAVVQLANKQIAIAYTTEGNQLVAQILDARGVKIGSELPLVTKGSNGFVDLLANEDGGFTVSWTDDSGQDGSGAGVHTVVVDADNKVHMLKGGAGADELQPTSTAQWHIMGLGGGDAMIGTTYGDTLDGGSGADKMGGLTGDDVYIIDNKSDLVVERADQGRDTIRSSVTYTLPVNVEVLVLTGKAALGGTGNDDANLLTGNTGANKLDGSRGDDTVQGASGNDSLVGGMGNDRLEGGTGTDRLNGGYGDDTLLGGAGKDVLTGEAGNDVFAFAARDSGSTRATADRIADFDRGQGDRIDLSAIDARPGGKNNAFAFIGTAAFSGKGGEVRYELSGGHTYISADTNGDRKADLVIDLDHAIKLTAADFIL
ncbi:calcium-binding protein [Sphingomonas sp. ID0503]|uniref:calcium-binding protein n=1 Tax=Sphingomonas sp. ID0503 TaxID=3399691 RepID=UPI003AFAEEA1